MKIVVCEECSAEYQVKHDLEETLYIIKYCRFCGNPIDLQDDNAIEEWED